MLMGIYGNRITLRHAFWWVNPLRWRQEQRLTGAIHGHTVLAMVDPLRRGSGNRHSAGNV
jgi:hypothetical protein